MFFNGRFANIFSKLDGKVEADKDDEKTLKSNTIFAIDDQDGASIVEHGGSDAVVLGSEFITQKQQIEEYRRIAKMPEVRDAVDEIANDAVSVDDEVDPVALILDDVEDVSEETKNKILEEFENVLRLLDFNNNAFKLFKRQYVDGRMYVQCVINEKKPMDGIKKVIQLDPRATKLVERRQYETDESGVEKIVERNRVFLYNPTMMNSQDGRSANGGTSTQRMTQRHQQGVEMPEDTVVYVYSDEVDHLGRQVGMLHDVVKPANDLMNMEDAVVIYRIVNAPERRVYYVDVGSLPTKSAEELLRKTRARFQNKVAYDSETGTVKSETKHMSLTDSLWLPRREGTSATEVDTLQGGQNLGEIDDLAYFLKRLQKATQVPMGRLQEDNTINIGGGDEEITREELKFSLFVARQRRVFNRLLLGLLKRQLILKKISTKMDWDQLIAPKIKIDYVAESYVKERHQSQQLLERFSNLAEIEPYVGSLISRDTVMKTVLRMTEEDIKDEMKKIEEERKAGVYGDLNGDPNQDPDASGLNPQGETDLKFKRPEPAEERF